MSRQSQAPAAVLALLALVLGALALDALLPALRLAPLALPDALQTYVTVFLGIFIEAAPFLLMGSLVAGLIAEFITPDDIARFYPRSRLAAPLAGALLGMVFPVCECGVVPVVRRLYQKGFPVAAGVAFLLGAPVLNPIVIASTYAAFGLGPMFWGRLAFTLLIAAGVGLVFSASPSVIRILAPRSLSPLMGSGLDAPPVLAATSRRAPFSARLHRAFSAATDELFDMGRYLVIGALIATTLQTFVPQQTLLGIGQGQVSSVIALQALAFVLSVCSTVDAFLALSFVNTFTVGAVLAFLVFGPMVDVKSTLLYLNVFRPRAVLYAVAICFLAALLIGAFINLNVAW
jgi:uncharacterized membrane protein YraQ (UPF0718 family)